MFWEPFGHISGEKLAAIYAIGLIFGVAFNWATGWAKRNGFLRGRTSIFVMAGVLVTVALTAVVSLPFALVVVGEFVFTGAPMIVGDLWRAWRDEQEALRLEREEIRNGYPR